MPTAAIPRLSITDLPRQPDLSRGLCACHPHPDWWTSSSPREREAAISVCRACPLRPACAEWSLSLPVTDTAIYGGMSSTARIRIKRQRRARELARREAQRRYGRESEKRRRTLGKAPTTAERYAEDPEPFKRQAAAYYERNREQILAKRRARYAAAKAAAA